MVFHTLALPLRQGFFKPVENRVWDGTLSSGFFPDSGRLSPAELPLRGAQLLMVHQGGAAAATQPPELP